MAEYIDRDVAVALIEARQKELCPVGRYGRGYVYGSDREKYDAWDEIIDALENITAADVAPVVRCKDCTQFQQTGKYYNGVPYGVCYRWYYEPGASPNEVDGNDFCSCGTPKEG